MLRCWAVSCVLGEPVEFGDHHPVTVLYCQRELTMAPKSDFKKKQILLNISFRISLFTWWTLNIDRVCFQNVSCLYGDFMMNGKVLHKVDFYVCLWKLVYFIINVHNMLSSQQACHFSNVLGWCMQKCQEECLRGNSTWSVQYLVFHETNPDNFSSFFPL